MKTEEREVATEPIQFSEVGPPAMPLSLRRQLLDMIADTPRPKTETSSAEYQRWLDTQSKKLEAVFRTLAAAGYQQPVEFVGQKTIEEMVVEKYGNGTGT